MSRPGLAADRAIQVLNLLITHPSERFTLSEISARTRINRASAHAIVKVLELHGYLRRHRSQRTYGLGPALVPGGAVALRQTPALAEAVSRVDDISTDVGLEVAVTMPLEAALLTVARSGHVSEFGALQREGHTVPWLPPLGPVYLAWSSVDEVREWYDRAPGITDSQVAQLERVLEFIRANGYSVAVESSTRQGVAAQIAESANADYSGDPALGALLLRLANTPYQLDVVEPVRVYAVSSVVAPVFDADGRVVLALHVSGFAPGLTGDQLTATAERVRGAAAIITKLTDGRPPNALWA